MSKNLRYSCEVDYDMNKKVKCNCIICNKYIGMYRPSHIKKTCSKKCLSLAIKRRRIGTKHSNKTKLLIGKKSKEKWTPKYCKRLRLKYIGSKTKDACGYIDIKNYNHPHRNNHDRVPEHRLVVEKKIGRYLKKDEIVHHIDFNRSNNNINNLYLYKNHSDHFKGHSTINNLISVLMKRKIIKFKNGKYELI